MRQRLWITFILVLVLAAGAFYVAAPHTQTLHVGTYYRDVSLHQGLDLKGGASLTYEADTSKVAPAQIGSAMDGVRNVFESRINGLGVTEPEIRITSLGSKQAVTVDLPGVTDVSAAKELLGSTAKLEFRDSNGNVVLEGSDLAPNGAQAAPAQSASSTGLASTNTWEVDIQLTAQGRDKFAQATAANINKPIGIYLDDTLIENPTVQSAITNGQAVITGGFTAQTAHDFAVKLNAGALPVPVNLVSENTVGASLGTDAIAKSLIAGLIGILALLLYIIAYYRIPGLIAALALIIYSVLNIALYKLLPVTLTLAGIAGFIISIGIAVDTNILTFERLKEELRLGKPLPVAINESFKRSWTSIRDSHIAGLLSASIIFLFATGSVRGFAVVLIIGTLLSLFTAITITRNWMLLLAGSKFGYLLTRF